MSLTKLFLATTLALLVFSRMTTIANAQETKGGQVTRTVERTVCDQTSSYGQPVCRIETIPVHIDEQTGLDTTTLTAFAAIVTLGALAYFAKAKLS